MKSKTFLVIIVLILLVASFTLGYHSGYRRARKGIVFVSVDTRDTPPRGSAKAEYDPYFTKRNPIPAQNK